MAVKRGCESKSYLRAKGVALIFKGVVGKTRYEELKKCVQWYIHKEEKGENLILYFLDDNTHANLMEYMRSPKTKVRVPVGNSSILTMSVSMADYFGWRIDDEHVYYKDVERLHKVLPEILADGTTFEEYYNDYLESTTRDENGKLYTSRTSNVAAVDMKNPSDMKTLSINEFKTNGHF